MVDGKHKVKYYSESKFWFYAKIILVIVFIILGMKYFYAKRQGFQTKPSFIKGVTPDSVKDKKDKDKDKD